MTDKNIEKVDPSEGQSTKDAVDKIDKDAPFSLEEAEAVVDAEEGHIEEAIEKSKTEKSEKETRIAPDLLKLKKEQTEKKKEVKQKKAEIKKEVKKEVIAPSKFEGKTPEERQEIYLEMEKSFTQKSQKVTELEAKITELDSVNKKIEEYEKNAVINQQKITQVKLPDKPKMTLFYDDPEKYFEEREKYEDAKRNAQIAPLYGQNWETQKQNVINKLKEATEKDVVPYKDVEGEVESRVKKNPALVNQYGLNARQYFYTQIRNEQLPQKIDDIKNNAKEEAKKELAEENKENSESQIMTSDITTEKRESAQVDFEKQLDGGADPEKVIQAIKKKHGITSDI